jgi:hypothetical protein
MKVPLTFRLGRVFVAAIFFLILCHGPIPAESPQQASSHTRTLQHLPLTHGINYDPFEVDGHPDALSSANLDFQAKVDFKGGWFMLAAASNPSTCSGPCNARAATAARGGKASGGALDHNLLNCKVTGSGGDKSAVCSVKIVRFAQFGRVEGPKPFDWLIEMEQGDALLAGTLRAGISEDGELVYPATVQLGGKMIITILREGEPPIRLRSRTEPRFEGVTAGWPPYGLTLRLVNRPIRYYLESELDNPAARPFASVASNKVTIGKAPSPFFATRPQITSAQIVDPAGAPWKQGEVGGVALRWTPTAGDLGGFEIDKYHVYRNLRPKELEGWERIASISAEDPAYVDTGYTGLSSVAYLVTHSTTFPVGGYEYEGLPGIPFVIKRGASR